jgi:hypothetical protein
MLLSQKLLDTIAPCSYNPSNYRIHLKNNDARQKRRASTELTGLE